MDPSGITEPIPFEIGRDTADGCALLSIHGEVDLASAADLEQALAEYGDEPVLLDLRDVVFMDSTGLSVLLRAAATRGASLRLLAEPQGPVRRLLDVAGVEGHLQVYASPADARAGGWGGEPSTG
jgi:anti-anti-sigma factor